MDANQKNFGVELEAREIEFRESMRDFVPEYDRISVPTEVPRLTR